MYSVSTKNLFRGCEIKRKLQSAALISILPTCLRMLPLHNLAFFACLKNKSMVSIIELLITLCHLFIKSRALLFPVVSNVCAKLRLIACWWGCDGAHSHEMRGYYRIAIHTSSFLYIRPKMPQKSTQRNRRDLSIFFFLSL